MWNMRWKLEIKITVKKNILHVLPYTLERYSVSNRNQIMYDKTLSNYEVNLLYQAFCKFGMVKIYNVIG